MLKRYFAPFTAFCAALLLAGCANKPPVTGICPMTGFIDNTDTITYLVPNAVPGAGEKNVVVHGSINGYRGSCAYANKKKTAVKVDLKVPFVAQKGLAGAALKQKTFPYFIGVLSPSGEILQRKAFKTTIDFDNSDSGTNTEDHSIKIPLANPGGKGEGGGASHYKVIIGFALTRAQYAYNKEQKK